MSLVHEQQHPLPASPLIPPPSMDVATLISSKESNGLSYSTPSSNSTSNSNSNPLRPNLSLPSQNIQNVQNIQNMPGPSPTSAMVNGRIYRYAKRHGLGSKSPLTKFVVWTSFNSRFGLACADLETRSVRAIEAAPIKNVGTEGPRLRQDSHR